MGVINAENMMQFRSSSELFNRIKNTLKSYDSQNMIDTGDFYDHVVYVLERLGVGVFEECEALVRVEHKKAKLPCNFKWWYAAYKCTPNWTQTPSINEQIPWIYYQDTEITKQCNGGKQNCCIECVGETGKNKIVIRTFVNGDPFIQTFHNPIALSLSPNVKDKCAPNCLKIVPSHGLEVTIDHKGYIHTHFDNDCIYMQYYGLPFDENYLPMIPDVPMIEQAIEYYILTKLFEDWYLNSTVPDAAQKMQYAEQKYNFHMGEALYYVKLPSFQKMVQSLRMMRNRLKFYNFNHDRTRVGYGGYNYNHGINR